MKLNPITRRAFLKGGIILGLNAAFPQLRELHAVLDNPVQRRLSGFLVNRVFGLPGHPEHSIMASFSMRRSDKPVLEAISPSEMPIFWCPEDGVKDKDNPNTRQGKGRKERKGIKSLIDYIDKNRFRGTFEEFVKSFESEPHQIGPKLTSPEKFPLLSELGLNHPYQEQLSFFDFRQKELIDLNLFTLNGHLIHIPQNYLSYNLNKENLLLHFRLLEGDLEHSHGFAGINSEKIYALLLDISTRVVNGIGDIPGDMNSDFSTNLPSKFKTRRYFGDYLLQVRDGDYHALKPCTQLSVKHFSIDIHEREQADPKRFNPVYNLHIGYTMFNGRVCFVFYNSVQNPVCCYMCKLDKKRLAVLVFNSLLTVSAFAGKVFFAILLAEALADFIEHQYNVIAYQWQQLTRSLSQGR